MMYFTTGPSQILPSIESYMAEALRLNIPSISHRSTQFQNIYEQAKNDLFELLKLPEDYKLFFVSSASEIFHLSIQNLVNKKSFHFVNGAFSKKYFEASLANNKQAQCLEVPVGESFEDSDFLKVPEDIEVIFITINETSTGACISNHQIEILRKANPNKLIVADIVSIAPHGNIDFKLVDSAFFSVQKGFGLPAGLAIWLINDKCLEVATRLHQQQLIVQPFNSIIQLNEKYKVHQTLTTPNVLGIFLFSKVVNEFNKIGIDNLNNQIENKAKIFYDFFENNSVFSPLIQNKKYQSKTTLVLTSKFSASYINSILKKYDMAISSGYAAFADTQIRIGNFSASNTEQAKQLLSALRTIE